MSKYSTVESVAVACKLWMSQQYTKVNQYLHCLTFQYTHWLEVKKKGQQFFGRFMRLTENMLDLGKYNLMKIVSTPKFTEAKQT